jgi:hypothetical protein
MELLKQWNARKRKIFDAYHVEVAWSHLREQGWFDMPPLPS